MPIHPDQHNVEYLRALMDGPEANSYARERLEVNTAITYLAVVSRVTYPNAKFLVLDDGDQGEYGYLYMIEDADGTDVLTDPDSEYATDISEGYDSWLYDNHCDAVFPYLRDGITPDQLDREGRNPWRGAVLDIDKILANPPALLPDKPTITIPEDAWTESGEPPTCILTGADGESADDCTTHEHEEDGDQRSRLTTTIVINGTMFHLDAYEVRDGAGGYQEAVQGGDNDLNHYAGAAGADGPFSTTTIDGRQYVLFATPFC